jgi:hypothetical protein
LKWSNDSHNLFLIEWKDQERIIYGHDGDGDSKKFPSVVQEGEEKVKGRIVVNQSTAHSPGRVQALMSVVHGDDDALSTSDTRISSGVLLGLGRVSRSGLAYGCCRRPRRFFCSIQT